MNQIPHLLTRRQYCYDVMPPKSGAGEVCVWGYWARVHPVSLLQKDLSLPPSNNISQLTTTCEFSSGKLDPSGLCGCLFPHAQNHTNTHNLKDLKVLKYRYRFNFNLYIRSGFCAVLTKISLKSTGKLKDPK